MCISTPGELVKVRMQADKEKFNSLFKMGLEIYHHRGFYGLYRGFCVSINRDFISYGSYFWAYYMLKDYWEDNNSLTHFKLFCAGGIAGVISWIIGYPFDPMKTIIQANLEEKKMTQLEAVKIIYSQSGLNGFFRGLTPVLVRAFLVHGVTFKTNEICNLYFREWYRKCTEH